MDGAPTSLDPAQASTIYASFLVVNLFDTLYRYRYLARPYELAPNLAEDMPQISADGLKYTIRIKPGIRFIDDPVFPGHKGRLVRAEDVVYSLKRHFDPATRSQGAWLWQGRIVGLDDWKAAGSNYDQPVSGLSALDEHTIEVQLVSPFPQFTHTLAHALSAVVPREAVEAYGREFAIRPVGSGPYRLLNFDNSRAKLVRNEGFRQEPISLEIEGYSPATQSGFGLERIEGLTPPLAGRIEIEFIAEEASRWNAFNSGLVDFVRVPVSHFDQVLATREPPSLNPEYAEQFHLLANLESGFVRTDFNMDDPRIGHHSDPEQNERNKALRCAIVKAFDWNRRNEVFYSGLGKVFPGVIPPVTAEFDQDLERSSVTRDVDGAIDLLRTHGWNADNLPVLEYGFPSSVTERLMFEQFRSFLEDIGYPGDRIRPLTFATYGDYSRAFLNREVMLITSGWTMDYPDAENTMQLFFGPNASPGTNQSNFNNERFNELFHASSVMPPSPARTSMYGDMNQIVIEECVTISGISRTLVHLWDRDIAMLPDPSFVGGFSFRFTYPGGNAGGEESK